MVEPGGHLLDACDRHLYILEDLVGKATRLEQIEGPGASWACSGPEGTLRKQEGAQTALRQFIAEVGGAVSRWVGMDGVAS
jgi:hypothetical protein